MRLQQCVTDCARTEDPAFHLTTAFASKDLRGRGVKQVGFHFGLAPVFHFFSLKERTKIYEYPGKSGEKKKPTIETGFQVIRAEPVFVLAYLGSCLE